MPLNAELLSFKFNPSSSFIKVIIDSSEEISVEHTALLARDIKNDSYIISSFPEGLRLEVGTPGVGSELMRPFQYKKNVGRNIDLVFYDGNEIKRKTYSLIGVNKNGIIVEKKNKKYDIFFNNIKSAKIKVSFD